MRTKNITIGIKTLIFLLLISLIGCISEEEDGDPDTTVFNPQPSEFEHFNYEGNTSFTFYSDIRYDEKSSASFGSSDTLLDIAVPESDSPTPLLIYFHGGGFVAGDKDKLYNEEDEFSLTNLFSQAIDGGAAIATVNYRYMLDGGILRSLNDGKRALQFLRYHAEKFNVDPNKIAVLGDSAGAGISLWLAFNDDLAQTCDTCDFIDETSTRIVAAAAIEAQATYNLSRWSTDVFPNLLDFEEMRYSNPAHYLFYYSYMSLLLDQGLPSLDITTDELIAFMEEGVIPPDLTDTFLTNLLSTSEINISNLLSSNASYITRIDLLDLMSNDDPEFLVFNFRISSDFDTSFDEFTHHPFHARALMDEAESKQVVHTACIPELGVTDSDLCHSDEVLSTFDEIVPYLINVANENG